MRAFLAEQPVEAAERLTHGGRHAYEVGCRCDACRTAWNDYHRAARQRQAAKLEQASEGLRHGTVSTYRNHGCRCEACFQAQAEWNRRRPSRAKAAMIPRHELPGRIVLTIGLFTSRLCVVGLIILWLG
jgi:hypothetical protein